MNLKRHLTINSLRDTFLVLLFILSASGKESQAQIMKRIQSGNILVTIKDVFSEYDLEGNLIQTVQIPLKGDVRGLGLRGIDCDSKGTVYGLVRSTIDSTGEARHEVVVIRPYDKIEKWIPLPTEGTASLGYLGDVDVTKDGKIAVLVKTFEAYLIDPATGSSIKIPSGKGINLAANNKYYVAEEYGESRHTTSVYTDNMTNQENVFATHFASTIAVDSAGNIRLGRYGQIFKFGPDGTKQGELEVTKNWSGGAIGDMEFLPDDSLIAGSRDGTVYHIGKELNTDSVRQLLKPEKNASDSWVCYVVDQQLETQTAPEQKRLEIEKEQPTDSTKKKEVKTDSENNEPENEEEPNKGNSTKIYISLMVILILVFAVLSIILMVKRKTVV